jgi:DNA/RNA endonuclease G (NUC1)
MKIAAHKNPKGITNTRNKLAIPTGIWRIAWLYRKKGIASEKTKYTKVIIVPDEA